MKYDTKNYFVLEYKFFEKGCEFGGHYVIAEKSNFDIGGNVYSIDEDEYSEVKGNEAKKLLEIANKFDNSKTGSINEQKIGDYTVRKYEEIPTVLYITD